MRNKKLNILIAAVILTAMIGKLKAIELSLLEADSTMQQMWDPTDLEIKIDEQPDEDKLNNLRKEEALEKLKELLGIQGQFEQNGQKDVPPQFMVELYNTITDSNGKTRAKNPYNAKIVRSFNEKDSSSLPYYTFNISGLEQNESVLEAELHLYRKRSSPKTIPPSVLSSPYYLVRVYQVLQDKTLEVPDLHRLLNVHYVGAYAAGWQIFNVKQAVLSWLSGTPNLGLLVTATTIFGDLVSVEFSRRDDLPHDKQPILVLFNDDGMNIRSKQVKNDEDNDDNDDVLEQNTELKKTSLENKMEESDKPRSKRYTGAETSQLEEVPKYMPENRFEKFCRVKKYKVQFDVDHSQKIHEFISKRRNLEHVLTSMDIYQRAMLRKKLNLPKKDIDMPGTLEKRSRIRRDVFTDTTATAGTSTYECRKSQSEPCAKRELYVNFRDIGLSTIIAPEGYAAYQCSGHCESPLSQEQKPTNHAIIQGIMHKMNLASSQDVETPCCVPVNLSSISILYHDGERDGVVLKNYIDMVVVNCGCR